MFRGHVPPVPDSKAGAIVNSDDKRNWACVATTFGRWAGLFFQDYLYQSIVIGGNRERTFEPRRPA